MDLRNVIRTIPNFPKEGIMFRDITTLLSNPEAFSYVIGQLAERYKDSGAHAVVGIESRGFIIGGALALKLGIGFVPVRKAGKLPGETESVEYELEYGKDKVEIHKDAIEAGNKVILIDDLIATGGTASAACQLIEKIGGEILECAFIVDLPDLKGKEKLGDRKIYTMVEFEGD